MADQRILIVNADDFGQSEGVNRGIIHAHRSGVVTSASLLVRHQAAAAAVALSRDCPALSVGLHIDLGEWRLEGAAWVALYEVVSLADRLSVQNEVRRQIATFRDMMNQNPTHIDSHQHVHLRESVRSIVESCSRELNVPLRHRNPAIRYCGDFYGQDVDGSPMPERITVEGLIGILNGLRPGITECCCHPAAIPDLRTMYSDERVRELHVLCDPRVREAIASRKIALCSFRDVMFEREKSSHPHDVSLG